MHCLTSLVPQDVLPLPVKSPHVEKVIQDTVVHTRLLLFNSTGNAGIVPSQGVIIITIPQGIVVPMLSSHNVIGQLHMAQDHTINDLKGFNQLEMNTKWSKIPTAWLVGYAPYPSAAMV